MLLSFTKDKNNIFKKLNDEGHTVILITHEKNIAAQAKRVVEIADGKIVGDERNRQ